MPRTNRLSPGGGTIALVPLILVLCMTEARAQRANENAVTSSEDAFGTSIGNEKTGLYSETDVRGFSPVTAGNRRIEGLYFDLAGPAITSRFRASSAVRVGLPALNYPFPAPTGIVDYRLRPAGDDAVASIAVGTLPYDGYYAEIDAQLPVIPGTLSVAAGASFNREKTVEDAAGDFRSFAVIPQFRFKGGEIKAFLSLADNRDVEARPLVISGGAWLPRLPEADVYYTQRWIVSDTRQKLYGALGRFDIADGLTLRAGAFEARTVRPQSHTALFTGTQIDGSAREMVIAEPQLVGRWTSGEIRLSWTGATGAITHSVHLSARGRDKFTTNGGGDTRDLGAAMLGVAVTRPRPDFVYSGTTQHRVKQAIGGIAYIGKWRDVGELNIGLQKTDYRIAVETGGVARDSRSSPWLYNATVAVTPLDWLAIYGGLTRGLEETAAPPTNAVNRADAAPASRTEQKDAGVRVSIGAMRLVAGVFDISKPYFTTDAGGIYGDLGTVRHRGAEFSLVGPVTDRLSLVAGAVVMKPRVTGAAVEQGRVGPRPVGTTGRFARVDLDYRVPGVEGLSLNLAAFHSGPRIADARPSAALGDRQLEVPSLTSFDVGARYRFAVGKVPVMFRAVWANVTDERSWRVVSSRAFQADNISRFNMFLAADF